MKSVLAVFALVCFAGTAVGSPVDSEKPMDPESAVTLRNMMIGRWVGDTPTKDGGHRAHIVDRNANGTMKIMFRVVDASGNVEKLTEVAVWGISGPVYFTITRGWLEGGRLRRADPTQAYYYDAYEVLELTEQVFRYRHFSTGNEYEIHKVALDYELPE